ncbi:Glucose--fructose oxidoreductase precursor [Falsiruegeria litorea R37]|uniref:Glucose--fructose oxidoreductase n=1 Tax=Falsiruegeria litorea R37 TaxID=1200284 RepID=A0A1Y5T4B5_9RHOB|nr:Gfo/Idh/MocA family oxidoreductase [Falsiruegeria litorea]SLN53725.1 Glucose--fructose oxidoreductase precursor [Falsiruegeria litorea R37]
MSRLFRWGCLSTAKIAREQVLPAILRSETGVLHAISSRNAGKAQLFAGRFGAARWYDSNEALLADQDVDGVYIPLPTSHHTEWAIRAAEAGKHVLCEKPIALKAPDIDRIAAAGRDNNVLISEAYMVWYHPQWHKVRELIEDGAIGRLRQVTGGFSFHNVDPANTRNQLEAGGGALPDIGVYPIITTLMSTGAEPLGVEAQVEYSPEFKTDIYAQAVVRFAEFNLSFHVSTQMALHQSMRFLGEFGWIDVRAPFNAGAYGAAEVVLYDQLNTRQQMFRFTGACQYELQVEAFARACAGNGTGVVPLSLSRQVQEIIDQIYAAGQS